MLAYHNDPNIKATYLARVRAHRAADELIHGTYWDNGKGCAVGCTLHSADHLAYEHELGIPVVLAYLEDRLFEMSGSPDDTAWPEQFLDAIPIGADLSSVWPQYAVRLLSDPTHGCLQHVQGRQWQQQRIAITRVLELYIDSCMGNKKIGARAARAAAEATEAAWAAAEAIEAARAAGAARAARAARAAAWAAHVAWQRETLLALLRAAPISDTEGR